MRDMLALVIEDDPIAREELVEMVGTCGWPAHGVETVSEATDLILRTDKPTAALVDIVLRGEMGFDFVRAVHHQVRLARIGIIYCSGSRDERALAIFDSVDGLFGFLRKPLCLEKVATTLERTRAYLAIARRRGTLLANMLASTERISTEVEIVRAAAASLCEGMSSYIDWSAGSTFSDGGDDLGRDLGSGLADRVVKATVAFSAAARKEGLDPESLLVLLALVGRSGVGAETHVFEMVGLTGISQGTLLRRLDALEKRGWLGREPDSVDRRRTRVALTAAGRGIAVSALGRMLRSC